jgi:hypothetical protein
MIEMPPYLGEIKVGQEFEWEPYGSSGWPHAYAHIRVTKIVSYGEEMPFTEPDDDKPEAEAWIETEVIGSGKKHWNELSRFREACRPFVTASSLSGK